MDRGPDEPPDENVHEIIFKNAVIRSAQKHTEIDRVMCPDAVFYDVVQIPDIPEIAENPFTRDEETSSVTLSAFGGSRTGSIGSTTRRSVVFKKEKINNFIHDFTILPICPDSDHKMWSAPWGRIDPTDDELTPDLISYNDQVIAVVEFTTNQSGTEESLKRSFDTKKATYFNNLEKRLTRLRELNLNHRVSYFIVAIGNNGVMHNIQGISQDLVDELCFRYKCALALAPELEAFGYAVKIYNEELSIRAKAVQSVLASMEMKYGPLGKEDPWNPFTEEFYKFAIADQTAEDLTAFKDYVDQALTNSVKTFEKDYHLPLIRERAKKYNLSVKGKSLDYEDDKETIHSSDVSQCLYEECMKLEADFKDRCRAPYNRGDERIDRKISTKAVVQIPFLVPSADMDGSVNLSNPYTKEMKPKLQEALKMINQVHDVPELNIWRECLYKISINEVRRQDSEETLSHEEIEQIYKENLVDKMEKMGLGIDFKSLKDKETAKKRRAERVMTYVKLDSLEKEDENLSREEKRRSERIKRLLKKKRDLFLNPSSTDEEREKIEKEEKEIDSQPALGEKDKKDYHRARITIDDEDKLRLAGVGVGAKRFQDDSTIREILKDSRKAIHWDSPTDDIERFIMDYVNTTSIVIPGKQTGSNYFPIRLLKHAASKHNESSSKAIETFRNYLESAIGRYCTFVSDLATELAISLKQHCREDEFIVKKLAHYQVYLVIKPTRSDSHIFYSLMFFESDLDMAFDELAPSFKPTFKLNCDETSEILRITPFVSTNKSKLTNLVTLESRMAATFFYFCEFYEVPPHMDDVFNVLESMSSDTVLEKSIRSIHRMTNFCLLMSMHDKTAAEEAMTLSRYIFMEGFVMHPEHPRPHKMIEKFNENQKSRLEIFIQKRLFESCKRIILDRFKFEMTSAEEYSASGLATTPYEQVYLEGRTLEKNKKYVNLFNPVTLEPLDNPMQLISTWYLGYFKNKEESPQTNSIHQMFEKILGFEDQFKERYEFVSMKNPKPNDCGKHEFSPSVVKVLTDFAKNKTLKRTVGIHAMEKLEKTILDKLAAISLESMATLKATSNFSDEWYKHDRKKEYHRSKVMEKVVVELKEGEVVNLTDILIKNLHLLEGRECLHIDIFRKQQHGGLREIYVLEFPARVVQLVIETISKAICSFFQGETMTHPANKFKLPGNHQKRVQATFKQGEHCITLCTNDDAAKWNQGHFTTKFAIMLLRFTPSYMHPIIFRGLRLWMRKKIMIPPELLNVFEHLNHNKLSNDIAERMKEAYLGRVGQKWMNPGNTYIETKTGMMQGILHYTSSLFHEIYQGWLNRVIPAWVEAINKDNPDRRCVITTMESSDDSAIILTLSASHPDVTHKNLQVASRMFRFKAEFSKFLGIYDSVKSTKNTLDILEYNSEFFFGMDLFRPSVRWVAACTNISEQESFVGRQEEMANLCTSCLEGGCSILTSFFVNLSQGLLHYRLMGSSVSPLFKPFSFEISDCPDPSNGFFLVDNVFSAGLTGFKYNLWNMTQKTTLGMKMKFLVSSMRDLGKESEDGDEIVRRGFSLETSEAGNLVNSTVITYGDRKKANRLIERLNLPEDWKLRNELDPEIYFRRSRSNDEAIRKLAIKATSPGVTQSLSKSNSVPRVIASAVYVLSQNIVSLTSIWNEGVYSGLTKFRMMELIIRDKLNFDLDSGDESDFLSENEMRLLFPYHEDYLEIMESLSHRTTIIGARRKTPKSKKRTDVDITSTTNSEDYNLERICIWKWFPALDHLPMSHRVKESLWNEYKRVYAFLEPTIEDTLANSVFTSYQQLQNFLARCDRSQRVVHLTAAPVTSVSGLSLLNGVVTQDFFPGILLGLKKDFSSQAEEDCEDEAERDFDNRPASMKMKEILHMIYMLMKSPHGRRTDICVNLLARELGLSVNNRSTKTRRSYRIIQEVARYLLKRREDEKPPSYDVDWRKAIEEFRSVKTELVKLIRNLNIGSVGAFVQPQKVKKSFSEGNVITRYTGVGIWSGVIGNTDVRLEMESFGDFRTDAYKNLLTKIVLSSDTELVEVLKVVKALCYEFRVLNTSFPSGFREGFGKMAPGFVTKENESFLSNCIDFKQHFSTSSQKACQIFINPKFSYNWNTETINSLSLEFSTEAIKVKSRHERSWLKAKTDPSKHCEDMVRISYLERELEKFRVQGGMMKKNSKHVEKKLRMQEELEKLKQYMQEEVEIVVARISLGSSAVLTTIQPEILSLDPYLKKLSEGHFLQSFLLWQPLDPKISINRDVQTILDSLVDEREVEVLRCFIRDRFKESATRKGLTTHGYLKAFDLEISAKLTGDNAIEELTSSDFYISVVEKASKSLTSAAMQFMKGNEANTLSTISDEIELKANELSEQRIDTKTQSIKEEMRKLQNEIEEDSQSWDQAGQLIRLRQLQAELDEREAWAEEIRVKTAEELENEVRVARMEYVFQQTMIVPELKDISMADYAAQSPLFGYVRNERVDSERIMQTHPLFDRYLDALVTAVGFNAMRMLIRSKVFTTATESIVDGISWILMEDRDTFKHYRDLNTGEQEEEMEEVNPAVELGFSDDGEEDDY